MTLKQENRLRATSLLILVMLALAGCGGGGGGPGNRAPMLGTIGDQSIDEGTSAIVALVASDLDGDALSFTASPLPAFATFENLSPGMAQLSVAPGFSDSGDYPITVRVSDGRSSADQETFVLSVNDVNRTPMLAAIGDQAIAEGQTRVIAVSASDPDADAVALVGIGLPPFAILTDNGDGTGELTLQPGFFDSADYLVTVRASDTSAATDEETFTLSVGNVNRAPVLAAIGDQTIAEDQTLVIALSATDADGDAVALGGIALPGFASVTDNDDGTGELTLAPGFFDSGDYMIAVRVNDTSSALGQATFNLAVSNVNRSPILASVGDQAMAEGETRVIALSATDVDAETLVLSGIGLPAFVTLTDNGDGTGSLSLQPDFLDSGDHLITVRVDDPSSGLDQQTFILSVSDVNQPPVLSSIGDPTITEGQPQAIVLGAADADGDAIVLEGLGLPPFAIVTDNGDGTGALTLLPGYSDAGSYSFAIRGTDDGSPILYDEMTIQLTVLNDASNQVAAENALPGTADWGLTDPATLREIEGYASETSVNRGDPISLFVNTSAPTFTLEVFRTGWYAGLGARRVHGPELLAGTPQFIPSPDPITGLVEADWVNPYVLQTSDASSGDPWATGVYLARLTESAGRQSYIIFVVRDDAHRPDVLFQLPVTTYQAYNAWGGKSTYDFNSGPMEPWGSTPGTRATRVSFDRPYARNDYAPAAYGMGAGEFLTNVQPVGRVDGAGWDYNMVRWLEYEQYDVGYITNLDTHRSPSRLLNTNVFLSQGHDEYWSWEMRDNVEAARDFGIDLAFFASNAAYYQIRYEPSPATSAPDRVMAVYKDETVDPYFNDADPSNDHLTTVPFRYSPVSRPEEQLIGVQYVLDPVDGDIVVTNPTHWVFANTGLVDQSRLVGLLGYEPDGIFGPSPAGLITLAESPIVSTVDPLNTGTSHMTIYTAPSGASVFATGSLQWSWGLDDFNAPALRTSRLSAAAQRITGNVLEAFGATPFTGDTIQASCVRLVGLSDDSGDNSTSAAEIDLLDVNGIEISKAQWNLVYADSEETVGLDGRAVNAFDGDAQSFWQTLLFGPAHPHEIQIDLGGLININALRYLPRQDGVIDGTISDYEIYTSPDCASWGLVASGTWRSDSGRKLARFTR